MTQLQWYAIAAAIGRLIENGRYPKPQIENLHAPEQPEPVISLSTANTSLMLGDSEMLVSLVWG